MFAHLRQWKVENSKSLNVPFGNNCEIHPAIISLALSYAAGDIIGGNARCASLLQAFKVVIVDFQPSGLKPLGWEIDHCLKTFFNFITNFRPHCAAMGYAMKHIRTLISNISTDMSEDAAKKYLVSEIEKFYFEKISQASVNIQNNIADIIQDGETILTFSRSFSIEKGLLLAHKQNKRFRVVVCDSRPSLEGKLLAQVLVKEGIEVTYCLVNAISYVMSEVSTVFLGASSMMSNGAVISRVGSAVVASVAKWYNKPVLICCETYKFSERVSLDSICTNELGNPDLLVNTGSADVPVSNLSNWREIDKLKLLNVRYDTTPVSDVTMIITEVGNIPPTAVPVIVREVKKEGM